MSTSTRISRILATLGAFALVGTGLAVAPVQADDVPAADGASAGTVAADAAGADSAGADAEQSTPGSDASTAETDLGEQADEDVDANAGTGAEDAASSGSEPPAALQGAESRSLMNLSAPAPVQGPEPRAVGETVRIEDGIKYVVTSDSDPKKCGTDTRGSYAGTVSAAWADDGTPLPSALEFPEVVASSANPAAEYCVTSIADEGFDGVVGVSEIMFPASITQIGELAFRFSGIRKVSFESTTELTIGKSAFFGHALEGVITFKAPETEIGNSAFDVDSGDSLALDFSGVTKSLSIGAGGFFGIPLKGPLSFSADITAIGQEAFTPGTASTADFSGVEDELQINREAFEGFTLGDIAINAETVYLNPGAFEASGLTSIDFSGMPDTGTLALGQGSLASPDLKGTFVFPTTTTKIEGDPFIGQSVGVTDVAFAGATAPVTLADDAFDSVSGMVWYPIDSRSGYVAHDAISKRQPIGRNPREWTANPDAEIIDVKATDPVKSAFAYPHSRFVHVEVAAGTDLSVLQLDAAHTGATGSPDISARVGYATAQQFKLVTHRDATVAEDWTIVVTHEGDMVSDVFPDPELAKAVAETAMGVGADPAKMPIGAPVLALEELDVSSMGVHDLTGISTLVNLAKLNVADNAIVDASPLKGLHNLVTLEGMSSQDRTESPVVIEPGDDVTVAPAMDGAGAPIEPACASAGSTEPCSVDGDGTVRWPYVVEAGQHVASFGTQVQVGRMSDSVLFQAFRRVPVSFVPHTVSFDPHNGEAPTTVTVPHGDFVTPPADPAKEGSAFQGWYYNEPGIGEPVPFDKLPIERDYTLHAIWVAPECAPASSIGECFVDQPGLAAAVAKAAYGDETATDQPMGAVVRSLTELDASNRGITDLDDLGVLASVNILNLSGNRIHNATPIADLPVLEVADLTGQVFDFESIELEIGDTLQFDKLVNMDGTPLTMRTAKPAGGTQLDDGAVEWKNVTGAGTYEATFEDTLSPQASGPLARVKLVEGTYSATVSQPVTIAPAPNPDPTPTPTPTPKPAPKGGTAATGAQVAGLAGLSSLALMLGAALVARTRRP